MLHEWLPQSEIIIINGAAHLVLLDHADEFNSHVKDFLEK
jgi:pimeloyl-ACP methyl ester carboxylesterase